MVESLYHQYRDANPDRFRVGSRRKPFTDELGRTKDHPCFSCIVDQDMTEACKRCRNTESLKQATLKF
jgi:hypothetical protein